MTTNYHRQPSHKIGNHYQYQSRIEEIDYGLVVMSEPKCSVQGTIEAGRYFYRNS